MNKCDIQHNGTQHNDSLALLSVVYAVTIKLFILSVIMLNVVMLNVVAPNLTLGSPFKDNTWWETLQGILGSVNTVMVVWLQPVLTLFCPGVNFTIIWWATFAPKSFCQKITNRNYKHIKAAQKTYYEKAARKILVKLMPGGGTFPKTSYFFKPQKLEQYIGHSILWQNIDFICTIIT
jgi:hypothetical protein